MAGFINDEMFASASKVNAGSTGAPSYTNSSDILTGIYFPAPGQIGFVANGNANFLVSEFVIQSNKLFQFFAGMSTNYTVPGAYPYSVTDSADNVVYVDTTSSRTINLPNSATEGRVFTVKDTVGSAGTNNITITTPGGVVTIDGATSKIGNVNWGSWTFQFRSGSYYTISEGLGTGGLSFATGTANQVLVNGTSGSPVSGAITLTTPQDISTTSTPTFARVFTADGSAAAPAYSFTNATDAGLYLTAGNGLGFSVGGVNWIDISTSGLVTFAGSISVTNRTTTQTFAMGYQSGAGNIVDVGSQTIYGFTDTSSARTMTLATPSAAGRVVIVKDESGGAATNNITVSVANGADIDGSATFVINSNYGSVSFYDNGSKYFVI